jgi:isopentenyl diphosphate isomerase/L-lactate dehydrogenase-like FMN-dependent dehydrogenase
MVGAICRTTVSRSYRSDDARRAVDAGASAVVVSNHGGNVYDGAPATLRVLPDILDAVGSDAEVLVDGGVRRGGDVVKAWLWGPVQCSSVEPPRTGSWPTARTASGASWK